jgi:hypothetical protein
MDRPTFPTDSKHLIDESPDLKTRGLDQFVKSFEGFLTKNQQFAKHEYYKHKAEILRELLKSIQKLNKTMPLNDKTIKMLLNSSVGNTIPESSRNYEDSQLVLREVFNTFSKRIHPLEIEFSDDDGEEPIKSKSNFKKIRRN